MSRNLRQLRLQSEERWPTLYQFLAGYCHQDWDICHGTPESAVDAAVSECTLAVRRTVLLEWRDWSNTLGAAHDARRAVNDGLSVNVFFQKPADARSFMNMVYDKLIASVREETGDKWKP